MKSEPDSADETYNPNPSVSVRESRGTRPKPRPRPSPGKYYKQAYRTEWESMPDFQGWLKEVPGEPTRAYCSCCEKSLHAHYLSLLKHTCTLKHTNAAQKKYLKQVKPTQQTIADASTEPPSGGSLSPATSATSADIRIPVETTFIVVDPTEVSDKEHSEKEHSDVELDSIKSEEESMEGEQLEINTQSDCHEERTVSTLSDNHRNAQGETLSKIPRLEMDDSPLSTHVLDTARGNAVNGLHVSLYKLIDGRWTALHEGITTPDGRYTNFIKRKDFIAGRYKLHFDVDRYFELRSLDTLYPFVEIVFDVKKPTEHYHIPLLISPYGYTTYRGS